MREEEALVVRPEVLKVRRVRERNEALVFGGGTLAFAALLIQSWSWSFPPWLGLAQTVLFLVLSWSGYVAQKKGLAYLRGRSTYRRKLENARELRPNSDSTEVVRLEIQGALERKRERRERALALWKKMRGRALQMILLIGVVYASSKLAFAVALFSNEYMGLGALIFVVSVSLGTIAIVMGGALLKNTNDLRVEVAEQRLIDREMSVVRDAVPGASHGAPSVAQEEEGMRGALSQGAETGGLTES